MSDYKCVEVRDILGDELPVPLKLGHYLRFEITPSRWIDVELRDGEVHVRGARELSIEPLVSNEIVVKLR